MSLYLQVAVGGERYVLDAAHVVEIRAATDGADRSQPAATAGEVDLRGLFAAPAGGAGAAVLHAQSEGPDIALIVDRIDGLAALDDGEFCPLPPIGALGMLIDAVTTRLSDGRPMLRLRGERAWSTAAAMG